MAKHGGFYVHLSRLGSGPRCFAYIVAKWGRGTSLPFVRNLRLRENLARDCFTSTLSTVTNSVQNIHYAGIAPMLVAAGKWLSCGPGGEMEPLSQALAHSVGCPAPGPAHVAHPLWWLRLVNSQVPIQQCQWLTARHGSLLLVSHWVAWAMRVAPCWARNWDRQH